MTINRCKCEVRRNGGRETSIAFFLQRSNKKTSKKCLVNFFRTLKLTQRTAATWGEFIQEMVESQ